MPSLTLHRPKIELQNLETPKVDVSKIEVPKIEIPKIDVAKTVTDAAVAAGLVQRRRSRWPFVLGATVVVGLATFAYANWAAIQVRLGRAATWIGEQVGAIGTTGEDHEPVAFTAAKTASIEAPGGMDGFDAMTRQYPDGLGTSGKAAGRPDEGIPAADELRTRA